MTDPSSFTIFLLFSDAESDNSIEIATKRLPGRPRVLKTKKNRKYKYKMFFDINREKIHIIVNVFIENYTI